MSKWLLLLIIFIAGCTQNPVNPTPINTLQDAGGTSTIEECEAIEAEAMTEYELGLLDFTRELPARDYCMWRLAIQNKNEEFCNKMVSDKSTCLRNVAELTESPDICKSINESLTKNICFSNIGEATGNLSICRMVEGEGDRNYCFWRAAINHNLVNACDLIANEDSLKIRCKAALNKDVKLCNELESIDKDLCIKEVAIQLEDTLICRNIVSEREKENCMNLRMSSLFE